MSDLSERLGRLAGAIDALQRHHDALEQMPERIKALEVLQKKDREDFNRFATSLFKDIKTLNNDITLMRDRIRDVEGDIEATVFQSNSVDESFGNRLGALESVAKTSANRMWDVFKMILASGIGAAATVIITRLAGS